MKRLRKIFVAVLVLLLGFGSFLWYTAGPAVSPARFSPSGVIQFFPPSAETAQRSPASLKVATYNIGYASGEKNNRAVHLTRKEIQDNLEAMAGALKKLDADVLCLQEVDFQASRTFRIDQLEFLAHALKYPYGAYVVTWNKRYLPWPYWPPQYQFGRILSGQAILSRFPIEKQDLRWFEKPASNPFWYNWFYPDRVVQKVGIKIGSNSYWIWNVHLEAFDPKSRRVQSESLGHWVQEESSHNKIVAGDFNSVSQVQEGLKKSRKKDLEDTGEALQIFLQITGLKNAETENLFSFSSWDPMKKIDQILFDEKSFYLEKVGNETGITASDHLPIWAVFKM